MSYDHGNTKIYNKPCTGMLVAWKTRNRSTNVEQLSYYLVIGIVKSEGNTNKWYYGKKDKVAKLNSYLRLIVILKEPEDNCWTYDSSGACDLFAYKDYVSGDYMLDIQKNMVEKVIWPT